MWLGDILFVGPPGTYVLSKVADLQSTYLMTPEEIQCSPHRQSTLTQRDVVLRPAWNYGGT
jgi:hypothetical protein